jgi:hypothetical protein
MPCDDCSRTDQCPPCANEPERIIINDRCKCSHDRFRHNWGSENDGACSKPDCACMAYDPVTVETVELPEPEPEACSHACSCGHEQWDHSSSGHCKQCGCEGSDGHYPNGCEDTPRCVCEHAKADHGEVDGCYVCTECSRYEQTSDGCWKHPKGKSHADCPTCWGVSEAECMCCTPALADEPWAPPQPERRPPLRVRYSVAGGHEYETSVPGDACVTAEDGALIITHSDAQVLAITRVVPIKESL